MKIVAKETGAGQGGRIGVSSPAPGPSMSGMQRKKDITDSLSLGHEKQKRTKYPKEEVDAWAETLWDKPDEELTLTHARDHDKMFHAFCLLHGKNSMDWYGALRAIKFPEGRISKIKSYAHSAITLSLQEELIGWFNENKLGERNPAELTKRVMAAEFPEQWKKIRKAFNNYGIALRAFGVPEEKVREILELSLHEKGGGLRRELAQARAKELAESARE